MVHRLFWRQFTALVWKNWIVLSKHPWLNVLRCIILPIAYGIFLAVAQLFLVKPNNYGLGTAITVPRLADQYDGSLALVWADGTDGSGSPSSTDIISHITSSFDSKQLSNVKKADSPDDVPSLCPENFNGYSECYAAVVFNSLPGSSGNASAAAQYNYTLRADSGLYYVNVEQHTSSYEERVLPLQWAIDSAIIELTTDTSPSTPLEWPFTQETNSEQSTSIRLSYIRGLRTLLVLALLICYIGIAYQLPGSFMNERATQLTSHMKAMGLMDSARIVSWHVSISLVYLPAWIIVSVIWHYRIFTGTNGGLVFVIHLLLGLSLASWSFFVSVPFGKSPQLAAIASTVLAIVFAILALVDEHVSTGAAFFFSLFFPPGFYIFAIRAVCGFEVHQIPTSVTRPDPDNHLTLLPLIIAAIIDVFLWPWMAVLLERRLYGAHNPSTSSRRFWRKRTPATEEGSPVVPPGIAISIRNLGKDFKTSLFKRDKGLVTAIADLSLDIPKTGIYVLLGSNGAGKSTTMSILAGLLGRTRGTVLFEGGVERPPLGTIGLVPQKNVLFPELTCYQTLRLWRAIKPLSNSSDDEDIEQLLRDCDLGKKIHYNANALSGGQKRKLQLAAGLVGGSKILLVDECTSGVDPLSRRALWRTLTSVRHERTIVFTTHFLDEADLLADTIAVLAAPGRLVAQGTPVALKSEFGEGYTVQVSSNVAEPSEKMSINSAELLDHVRRLAPSAYITSSSPNEVSYHLKAKDPEVVHRVLELLEVEREADRVGSYSVQSTSIEDIFLGLMHSNVDSQSEKAEKGSETLLPVLSNGSQPPLELTNGRKRSPLGQAFTIFHKRLLVAKRSWLTPLLLVLVAVAGSCVPLFFISGRPAQTCVQKFGIVASIPLYAPYSPVVLEQASYNASGDQILVSPPGLLSTLGPTTELVPVYNISNNATFVSTINQNFQNLTLGGISVDLETGSALVAWEATPPGYTGLVMLNLASNLLFNHALNTSGKGTEVPQLITANFQPFPGFDAGTLVALKWVAFYGAAMSVFPAFFSLYVSKERRSSVQAMQLSNGLSNPVGLWLGHLMFDSMFSIIISSVMVIVFAAASNQFAGLGLFWVVLFLYGIVGALFSYCVSLAVTSPLAAFAASAGYQVVMFILYLAAFLLTMTYAKVSNDSRDLSIIHYTMSVGSPVASALQAAFVSVNLFSLLCDGEQPVTTASIGKLSRFGGPILYLIVYAFVLFGILVWVDSGSILPRRFASHKRDGAVAGRIGRQDADDEAVAVAKSNDALRVLSVVKAFGSSDNRVVDNVSFGVSQDTIFALLGPNGAGKTTMFNMIRGDVIPDEGDVLINGVSVVTHPRAARLSLGVCPQFTAIDSELTVEEHLMIYGRLKGLYRGEELKRNVQALMNATSLDIYAGRLAIRLSGGNQRKLALAIALIGNPSVVLIDEFSTGIDAKMKRDMWGTLRTVAVGKAIVITTHSMEEASALANKVGILAKKMLAVGTTDALAERYATYEVHFSCRSREEVTRAQELMVQIPGARMADDVATRFEVPIGGGMSLAHLFGVLSSQDDFSEYTVERATLESVFLKVIRENDILEEDSTLKRRRWWRSC
ncbi:P-loop containing nucleoside triphosphate hydrolase protein [Laetiporus sulphureus 93-53]|uniref:p-loop containing nucleoside triphosphate hydrolase protein n=1 Tax=Laetiporus sulphureus 93-53 TaxID=1314785 RepID=A0A165C2L6_9APHY|nr:P-loop containing nucleoside triphosphate hydrolase protein [Laetiporus sulphureus 93-53]KZT02088.1 P-loop containing nucleoside triphosphate hydrolase protein [Laetiporus sulphureus 93-53]